jgi:DNA-binding GntR family transcriptional regulator
VRWHVGLAEATGSPWLAAAVTDAQGRMSDLIACIAHPPELLAWSNRQHARMLACVRAGDRDGAMRLMAEHIEGTDRVLEGLLPTMA